MTGGRAALALISLLTISACGPSSPPADITIAHDAEPQTLDPALMTGVAEGRIAGALFEGLTRLDPGTLEVLPGVAESWHVSPDGRVWTFFLRESARWSDGRPVTAEDFRNSWLRVLSSETASAYAGLLFDVVRARAYQAGEAHEASVGIHAPEDRVFIVWLERPVPYFPSLAAFFTLLPVPERAVAEHGDRWTREGNIVTNGPFVLERWAFYREIVLRRSPTYWDRDRVGAERIRIVPVVDPNTQFNMYETGAVDVVFSVPSSILHRLHGRPDFVHGPRLATAFLRLNVTRPPFDEAEVRRAFATAVDRESIVTRILRGGEVPTGAILPPGLPGSDPARGLGFDPSRAAATRPRAGLPPVALLYPDNPDYAAVAIALQHMWKRHLGAEVRLDAREWKVYLSSMKRLDYDLALGQWIGDYPDPATFLHCFLSESGNNRTGWRSERYDDLIRRAEEKRESESPEEHAARRLDLYGQAEALLLDEAPVIPLYHPTVRFMVSPRVEGFAPNMMGLVRFADLRSRIRHDSQDGPVGEGR